MSIDLAGNVCANCGKAINEEIADYYVQRIKGKEDQYICRSCALSGKYIVIEGIR